MKKLILVISIVCFSLPVLATEEKPVQHLKVQDITSMADAKEIFLAKTVEIRSKKELGVQEASQIHIITYTLEKSVAYFAENLKGKKQSIAKEMAIVVEDIHLTSENSRMEDLKKHLKKYFSLVDDFLFGF